MKKFYKIFIITMFSLALLFGAYILVIHIPIKKVIKIDTVEGSPVELSSDDTRIFVTNFPGSSDPAWKVVGIGDTMFDSDPNYSYYVFLKGNYPKNISSDIRSAGNTFVLEGHYTEENSTSRIKTFEVTRWDILYPIKSYSGEGITSSEKDTLTIKEAYLARKVQNE